MYEAKLPITELRFSFPTETWTLAERPLYVSTVHQQQQRTAVAIAKGTHRYLQQRRQENSIFDISAMSRVLKGLQGRLETRSGLNARHTNRLLDLNCMCEERIKG